jgi:predicted PurR-regulated permease PerM
LRKPAFGENCAMTQTAKKAFVATLVAVGVVVGALALWKLKVLISLVFLGLIIAAAMRPGVDALARRRVPRPVSVAGHYFALIALLALLLWAAVPRALEQVKAGLGVESIPTQAEDLEGAKDRSTGVKHDVLVWLQGQLESLPSAGDAFALGTLALEVVVGIFFVLAVGAYWLFERDRAIHLVTSLVARRRRKTLRDTWYLIDLKLGSFVRGQALLMLIVGAACTAGFALIGLRYWLLVGALAGLLEIVPMIGPLVTGGVAVAVGLTDSWQTALWAALVVLVVQILENYVIVPHVLGGAVGLSPLTVLLAVTAAAVVFGGWAVLLAVPLAAVLATVCDVIVFKKNPAEADTPTVLFAAKESDF